MMITIIEEEEETMMMTMTMMATIIEEEEEEEDSLATYAILINSSTWSIVRIALTFFVIDLYTLFRQE